MEEELREAARAGDINKMYELLLLDRKLLEHIDEIPFEDTPLHVAAAAGCTHFAIEIMRLKPSFGKKLNPDGLSPLHLALQNGHIHTVRRLIKFDSELVRVKGKENFTPLHYVVERNQSDLLAEFLLACPPSIEDLTIRGESAVHIVEVKEGIKSLKVLLGWLERTKNLDVLNWQDENGDTALHVAASRVTEYPNNAQPKGYIHPLSLSLSAGHSSRSLQPPTEPIHHTGPTHPAGGSGNLGNLLEVLELLSNKLNQVVWDKNSKGLTVLDIVSQSHLSNEVKEGVKKVKKILRRPPIFRGLLLERIPTGRKAQENDTLEDFLISPEGIFEKLVRNEIHLQHGMSTELKNSLLVIAVLIVTAAYQAALTPPSLTKGDHDIPMIPFIEKFSLQKWNNGILTCNTIAFTLATGVILRLLQTSPSTMLIQLLLYILFGCYMDYVLFQGDTVSLIASSLSATFIMWIFSKRIAVILIEEGILGLLFTRSSAPLFTRSFARLQMQRQIVSSKYLWRGGRLR